MSDKEAEAPIDGAKVQEAIDRAMSRIRKARFQVITDRQMTFFGVVTMNMKPIPVTHIISEDGKTIEYLPTAATDGRHLFFNPDFINSITDAQVKGVLCHEVGHVTGFHHERQNGRENRRWNIATDIKINSGLRDIKIELPPGALYGDYRHNNMTSEEVYNTLPEQPPKGGGTDDPGKCGTFLSPRNEKGEKVGQSEARRRQNETRVVIEEAARMAKAQGSMPQFIERMINDSQHEPLSWKEILRRFVLSHVKVDYTWRRPNRRMIGQNVYLPSQKTEGTGEIVIGVDTSGSISQAILSAFAKEINTIMADAEPDPIHVVYCDAAVHKVDTFHRGETVEIKPVGGGGTDFSPVFRWVTEQGVNPMCLIYFTDLMGSFPTKPEYPVIWAATMDGNIPWGDKIMLNTTDQ